MSRKSENKPQNMRLPIWNSDHISIRGYSHKLDNKECQDTSCSWETSRYCGVIVCDGHGGAKYIRSATGSRFACEIGRDVLSNFAAAAIKRRSRMFLSKHSTSSNLDRLQRTIIMKWREAVAADLQAHPLSADERFFSLSDADQSSLLANGIKAYGTTFIAGIFSPKFLFVIKLGDGNACIALNDGTIMLPEELSDGQLQFNRTTSLCNSDADIQFRNFYMEINEHFHPVALILSSDGVINCYRTEDAFKSLIQNISEAYAEETLEDAHNELEVALNTLSEKGSGDDLSIAVIRSIEDLPTAKHTQEHGI